MIFAPGRFLGISDEIDARDMMMMPQTLLEKKKSARLASVALANKLARIIWAMMTSGRGVPQRQYSNRRKASTT